MRFALVTVALAAASASASSLYSRQNIPACAGTCIASADLGGCSATDNACLCKSTAFVDSTAACIETACTGSDLQAAIAAAEALCAAVGVTLSGLPTGSATTAAATGASSGSAAATTATTPASSKSAAASSHSAAASGSSTSSSAPAATSSKSAGSISGVNAFAGMAAFGLAALAL
ncbi:uncharacterized protein LACBIDRAFT_304862 [Laccaria bicolor S238N-H82]|uniref:Predicted protein n=1 Tax=Laccaria bicolor (strain S238N-H82 / ATCC MYA-4686) TaxID=486041 RepID=B0DMH9_LACBS|nr:uncharacterized protein LACBIDRAFT_304862 [Laccaria bicolor S238N-H82]EDR04189.1 predicted protein [Laccaria bicolor S238N-H82]|eukprot:XP_001885080.1 predicted protein [Laccaria bicolor S238N-H82]